MSQNQSHSIINDVLQSVLQNSLGSLNQNRNIEYNITFDQPETQTTSTSTSTSSPTTTQTSFNNRTIPIRQRQNYSHPLNINISLDNLNQIQRPINISIGNNNPISNNSLFSPIRTTRNPTVTAFVSNLNTNQNNENIDNFFDRVPVSLPIRYLRLGTHIINNNYIVQHPEDFNDHCSICQEPLINTNGDNRKIIRCINHCGHCFHQDCIDRWFETSCQCPMCRTDIRDAVDNENSSNQNTNNIDENSDNIAF